MAVKIILSLSQLRENAREYRYHCPGSTRIQTGVQTNEAPVKYLLSQDQSIAEILCIVTPTARETAYDRFCKEICKVSPNVRIEDIDAPDDGQLPKETMAELLTRLQAGDSVYLDSSGGNRYTVIGLMHLVRILEYKGIMLKGVVYANIAKGKFPSIDDVTGLYEMLDLISGMQELTDFGSVDTLKEYFREDAGSDGQLMRELLSAIEKMTDAITLCRLEKLEQAMQAYQDALEQAKQVQDPIMRELLEVFQSKFGSQITIPWVIHWCLNHRMLPQALSLYREWMPKYLLRQSGLFTALPQLELRWRGNSYQDDNVFLMDQFLNLSQQAETGKKNMQHAIKTLSNLGQYLPGSGFQVKDLRKAEQIGWDYLYVLTLRNMVLHSSETARVDNRLRNALRQRYYPVDFEIMTINDFLPVLSRSVTHAEQI